MTSVLRVVVTGSAGRIGYSFISMLCHGFAFGDKQKLDVVLFDIPEKEKVLEGIKMEVCDCGYTSVNNMTVCTDPEKAFVDADVIIFLGAAPRREGMQRVDLLSQNKFIFEKQGKLMEKYSKKTVKVLVVGNPANTNALILSQSAPSIPKENITSLMRLDQNRAVSMLCNKLSLPYDSLSNVVVWGNHSPTAFPCADFSTLENDKSLEINSELRTWIDNELVPTVRKRGFDVILHLGASSALSASKAICDHLYDWFLGTKPGKFVTMGVLSNCSYNLPSNLIIGLPVICTGDFKYEIVSNLKMSSELVQQVNATVSELQKEKELAFSE